MSLPPGFLELPHRVFADDPDWIPEDSASVDQAFAPSNPWFEQGEAVTFCEPGASRAAGFFQPGLRLQGRRVAFFGYWCSAGDDGADAEVLGRVEAWAAERGAEMICGPLNFTMYGDHRLLLSVESNDATPFPDEPYNPLSWPRILERLGWSVNQLYLTQVGVIEAGLMVARLKQPVIDALLAEGYRITSFPHDAWLGRLREMHGMMETIFGPAFAYSPLSYEAFARERGPTFIRRTDPEVSTACYAPDGSLAGFFLVYPHYGPLVRQGAGAERVAVTELDFATHHPLLAARPWRGAVAKTVGVHPAHRGKGIMAALTASMFRRGQGRYEHWYGGTIRKDNASRNYASGNTTGERWYGLFGKLLTR